VIPTPLPDRFLADFLIVRPAHEERAIREYVEIQARSGKVTHLEKIKTERFRARSMNAWDVRTTRDRYWVITNPTNFYSQKLFPSLDFTLSFSDPGLAFLVEWVRSVDTAPTNLTFVSTRACTLSGSADIRRSHSTVIPNPLSLCGVGNCFVR
jgi:hypothetical protein